MPTSRHPHPQRPRPAQPPRKPSGATSALPYEADVLEGLERFGLEELRQRFGGEAKASADAAGGGKVPFRYGGDPARLLTCRSLVGVYRVVHFDVPRPKALLGHQYFTVLVQALRATLALHPAGAFRTLRLSAAGAESEVLKRLSAELAAQTGLIATERDEEDLLLRLRRNTSRTGWEALVSLSPRPLASRGWRACNLPGAMNATLAYAMARMTLSLSPDPSTETVLNLCAGSGTLLIERAAAAPFAALIGNDISEEARACAAANVEAAGLTPHVRLEPWDATALPLPDASVDVLLSDLPFGQQVGSHRENERLYPRLLDEAARVARPGAHMALLTHEVRLLGDLLHARRDVWEALEELRVRAGGMNPRVFLARRLP